MATLNMTALNPRQRDPSHAKPEDVRCPPMSHQNSGSHGYEMYPQQFVRLVGCHNVTSRELRNEKLH